MCKDRPANDPCNCCPEIFLVLPAITISDNNQLRSINLNQRGTVVDIQRPDKSLILSLSFHDDRTRTITVYDENVLPFLDLSHNVRLIQRPDRTPIVVNRLETDTKLPTHSVTELPVSISARQAKKVQPVSVGVRF
jgi:hypothetical protein